MAADSKALSPTTSVASKELEASEIEGTRNEKKIESDDQTVPAAGEGDYSGAAKKSDPKEIALVRKLDRMIMVCRLSSPKSIRVIANTAHSRSSGRCTSSTTSTEMPCLRLD